MKAYVVSSTKNGTDSIDGMYYLVTEEGECLATHWCSHIDYAMGDLYLNRPERIKAFKERFDNFEVDYIGRDDMTGEELLKRNKKFYGAIPTEKGGGQE